MFSQTMCGTSKPGPYTIRLKFPAGFKVAPHTHPDSREVTVLSGTWYTGYGETPEASGLKELPAGSFYTEPANVAHYVEIREPTVLSRREATLIAFSVARRFRICPRNCPQNMNLLSM
jgi:hypothetical protein